MTRFSLSSQVVVDYSCTSTVFYMSPHIINKLCAQKDTNKPIKQNASFFSEPDLQPSSHFETCGSDTNPIILYYYIIYLMET